MLENLGLTEANKWKIFVICMSCVFIVLSLFASPNSSFEQICGAFLSQQKKLTELVTVGQNRAICWFN